MKNCALPSQALQQSLALITNHLARQQGVSRIWLFGSLAKGKTPDWRSDIDIAVEGLEASLLGRTWSELDAQVPRPLDLVRWEDARAALKGEILKWGKVLYG